jgi:hypothetical protein
MGRCAFHKPEEKNMNGFERVYTQCDICGRDIHYGNAVLEIQRNVEQHDYIEETGLRTGIIIDADPLLTSCASCGNSLSNSKKLRQLLEAKLELSAPDTNEDTAQQTEADLPESCNCCGKELKIGKARVSLVKLIGQMDWSDQRSDGELFVIDGEDVLSFCPDCGNKMSSYRLQQALKRILDDLGVPERMESDAFNDDNHLHGTSDHPVKIIELAAEGGRITLYGWKDSDGEWRFQRDVNENALYNEDTVDLELQHSSNILPGWQGALELLSRYPWYRLLPKYVHPEFAEKTLDALRKAPEDHQSDIDYDYWQAVCAGKDPWGEQLV